MAGLRLENLKTALDTLLSSKYNVSTFINARPATVDNCVTLVQNDGGNSAMYFGQKEQLGYPLVLMYIRHTSYQEASKIAWDIRDFMKTYKDESDVRGTIPVGNLSSMGRDNVGRSEILESFRFITEE